MGNQVTLLLCGRCAATQALLTSDDIFLTLGTCWLSISPKRYISPVKNASWFTARSAPEKGSIRRQMNCHKSPIIIKGLDITSERTRMSRVWIRADELVSVLTDESGAIWDYKDWCCVLYSSALPLYKWIYTRLEDETSVRDKCVSW